MTIKETAGKVLLYFYQLQRTVPSSMRYRQLGFIDKKDGGVSLTSDKKWLTSDLLGLNPKSSDIFNAYLYLIDKGYIKSRERTTSGALVYVGIHLTALGMDIVEGVEGGEEGQRIFMEAFNISADSGSVEALIGDNLSNLSEASE